MEFIGLRLSCIILVLFTISESGVANENSSCNSLRSLALALTSNDENMQKLTRVFYPPRQPSAKIVKVTYYFEDEMGEHDDCYVTYFWASGAFLLIQPLSIFQFTSLFFNHVVAGEETTLTITLPYACRYLVLDDNNTCICNLNEDILDLATHQVCSLCCKEPTIPVPFVLYWEVSFMHVVYSECPGCFIHFSTIIFLDAVEAICKVHG